MKIVIWLAFQMNCIFNTKQYYIYLSNTSSIKPLFMKLIVSIIIVVEDAWKGNNSFLTSQIL
jgi:hypothetical protein